MPPLLLLLPLLLVALLALLVLRRRRSDDATGTPGSARDTEEVRLLRLQVETLTAALHEVNTRSAAGQAATTPTAEPVAPAEPEKSAESSESSESSESAAPEPALADATPDVTADQTVDVAPDALSGPLLGPLPDLPTPPPADRTARAYAELSRSLARTGRLREAVLAQWAADVRVLAPLLAGRGDELCAALGRIDPDDPASTLVRARAAASALVGPSFALSALLADVAHLSGPVAAGQPAEPRGDVSADVLPDHVVRALESVLVGSAALAGDHRGVSVGLRCDLLAHTVTVEPPTDVEVRVRDILETHERDRFDTALAGRAS
ncbi:hypothetical protein FE634_17925 [Nocardioides dongxiaopingii]|uniref:hypothetical protein n=1 Tax=Nocardioides sp. S-1144 TaxID=2582905 RepID=UPI0011646558|nr:hypothetical protein [Nocardioides sp. S-1144]QCW51821.2 hypothetical protein FE634_17925 [Nocardioides sp. S-1144]